MQKLLELNPHLEFKWLSEKIPTWPSDIRSERIGKALFILILWKSSSGLGGTFGVLTAFEDWSGLRMSPQEEARSDSRIGFCK